MARNFMAAALSRASLAVWIRESSLSRTPRLLIHRHLILSLFQEVPSKYLREGCEEESLPPYNDFLPVLNLAYAICRKFIIMIHLFRTLLISIYTVFHATSVAGNQVCKQLKLEEVILATETVPFVYPLRQLLLCVATPREARKRLTRNPAFLVVAPSLWKRLPVELCLAPSLPVFERMLKTSLFEEGFESILC